jgi:hypothetical protein
MISASLPVGEMLEGRFSLPSIKINSLLLNKSPNLGRLLNSDVEYIRNETIEIEKVANFS